ncbi:uncharacterized protein EKO05_0008450 [Ascochyta rabiei]|uniref:Uncharacterized protein n=1 Tax=Didymella rabiei TaxID=5454 RepID=A0A163A3J7_DIDRA|nr:uncharacterized protein EKO05_0008450 [Ascochyta rabiei]KZM20962.1 hypothetical protein ST47_g7896 [Ascochyta rabiei]UPX18138.1 hypothetical protein EKO05_0008450 [Ascochyta rabiei]
MKVAETGTDRTASAHIYVDGRVKPLEEYGQYIDARDNAVCCYVAVEEGQKIKVDGRFSGVTLAVSYDFLVDGVCRKAHIYASKSVQLQKSKKLEFEKFLYQTPDGVIDTDILVSPHSEPVTHSKDAPETIGTMDLRVYITRQLGIEHDINDIHKYDEIKDNANIGARVASYKDVAPQFHMTFEKNCSTLDGAKGNRERRKVYAKRPGTEPWAIFRFHYRSKESILGSDMKLTFCADDKNLAKAEPHALEFELVPELPLGSKPASKNDGDCSVRTSSPAPTDMPSTPIKGSKRTNISQPKAVVRKQHTKTTSATTNSNPPMMPIIDIETATVAKLSTRNALDTLDVDDGQSALPQVKDGSSTTARGTETDKLIDSASAATKDTDGNLFTLCSKKSTKKVAKKASIDMPDTPVECKESVEKVEEPSDELQLGMADVAPKTSTTKADNIPAMSTSADLHSILQPPATLSTIVAQSAITSSTKDIVKNGAQPFVPPFRKTTARPALLDTTTSTLLKKPMAVLSPVTPVKRAPGGTLTPPPNVKRIKTDLVPPSTPTMPARLSSVSPSPRAMSIEAQVAEQRKRLEATRKKRAEMAAKKAVIDERMAPYKQRMTDELERLQQEMAAEQSMLDEEEEEIHASEAMLAEFERAGDNGV